MVDIVVPESGVVPDYSAIRGHYHIGSNMPGYLPEGDVFCALTVQEAADILADELERSQDFCADGCEGSPEQQEKGSDCCDWCREYWDIEAVLSGIRAVEKDVQARIMRDGGYGYLHTPPQGAHISFWVEKQTHAVIDCERHAEQCEDGDCEICPQMLDSFTGQPHGELQAQVDYLESRHDDDAEYTGLDCEDYEPIED